VLRGLPGIGEVESDAEGWSAVGGGSGVAGQAASGSGCVSDPGVVRADLAGVPAAVAIRAMVDAGVSVSSAAPRNRLEDVFLELVGAAGQPASGGGSR